MIWQRLGKKRVRTGGEIDRHRKDAALDLEARQGRGLQENNPDLFERGIHINKKSRSSENSGSCETVLKYYKFI